MKPKDPTSGRKRLAFALCSFCLLLLAAPARADIVIRLSVKAVLDPATGMRQPEVSELIFSNTVAGMNALLASFGRGYRYEWVGNALIDVGGRGQTNTGPSQYYNVDFQDDPNGETLRQQFESNAIAHPLIYGWDSRAANIYILRMGTNGSSSSSFPPNALTTVLGNPPPGRGYSKIYTVIHELGHHFNLKHTHQGQGYLNSDLSACADQNCGCARLIGGNDDLIADTIADHVCWNSRDAIAQGNYGMNYADLTNLRKAAVDRVWLNIMSYHEDDQGTNEVNVFTSDQLDRWTDSANNDRPAEVSGRTWFVDRNNGCLAPIGSSACVGNFGGPYPTVAGGIASARAGDIVLIRPGHYNEPMTLNKAITLRATRGDALLGIP
jgi:hypothetical protein